MPFILADRVQEISTTAGTGSIALGGAAIGYRTFASVLSTADTTFYTIADQGGANWEVGIGTFTSPSTLARTTILSSSNGGSIVTFGSGTKNVFITLPASRAVTTASTGVVTQAMLAANVTSNGPAFGAWRNGDQTQTSSVFTKVSLNAEEYDTNSNFDTSTGRFQPTVAGYYQINGSVTAATTSVTIALVSIYKNGSEFKRGNDFRSAGVSQVGVNISSLIYMNGSTDFLELYSFIQISAGTATVLGATAALTYFNGFLARAA